MALERLLKAQVLSSALSFSMMFPLSFLVFLKLIWFLLLFLLLLLLSFLLLGVLSLLDFEEWNRSQKKKPTTKTNHLTGLKV